MTTPAKAKGVHAAFAAASLAACALVLAQAPPAWVSPTHSTTEPQEKELTMVSHFKYREQEYDPPVVIRRAVPKSERRQSTPEEAMISRVSAMMAQDYDWWLETWDAESRQLTIENNLAQGRSAEYFLQWWGDTFRFANVALTRRVETGPYVVITYRLVTPSGLDAGDGIEFPSIFHQVDDRWLATLDLRRDPLVPASPWVSGRARMEQTVR